MNPTGSGSGSQRRPPPIPSRVPATETGETNPRIEVRAVQLIETLRIIWQKKGSRLDLNGNAMPALMLHVNETRDDLHKEIEAKTLFLPWVQVKWVALAAAAIALGAGGVAIHSCQENEKLEQRIEQLEKNAAAKKSEEKPAVQEKAKPKPNVFYVPKALSKPPQVPNRIPQRIARNSLRA